MEIRPFYALLCPPQGTLTVPSRSGLLSGSSQEAGPGRLAPSAPIIKLSLIIPTYNERENLPELLWQLTKILDRRLPEAYEIIVVDDNSRDRTWEIAAQLMAQHLQLWVMRRQAEQGLATAVVRGWQAARGQLLGVMDADFQHPPQVLEGLLDAIDQGADLALASRHVTEGGVSNWSLGRRFLSRGAQVLGLLLLPGVVGRVADPMSGYFVVRREAIAGPVLHPLSYKILLEVLARGRVGRIAEVGYVFRDRNAGHSKVHWRQYRDYVMHLGRLRWALLPWRFLRFGLVGLSGVAVDMLVLYGLLSLGWNLVPSKLVAAESAMVNNFLWNDSWTFRDLREASVDWRQAWRQRARRFLKFNLICGLGLGMNVLILQALVQTVLPNPYGANLVAIAITTLWNFWINLKLNWRTTQVRQD